MNQSAPAEGAAEPAVTIGDVAAAAGVSLSTVSRTFTSPDLVNPRTRARVLSRAHELGYTPIRSARRSETGSGTIGLIVPDVTDPVFPPIIKAVQARARQKGRVVLLADTDDHAADEIELARMLGKQSDGLIIAGSQMPESDLSAVRDLLPVVFIHRAIKGAPSIISVHGIRDAVQHLAALGHVRVCYLNGPRSSETNRQRRNAVSAAARIYEMEVIQFGPFQPEIQAGVGAADLVRRSGATAVIAHDVIIALGLMSRLAEYGLRVGTDLSIIALDDSPMSAMTHPMLTTVHIPGEQAGAVAVDVLIDLLEGGEAPSGPVPLEGRLVVRGSTGPAPATAASAPAIAAYASAPAEEPSADDS